MDIKTKIKLFEKCQNRKCTFCKESLYTKDIDNIIISKTKRGSIILAHKKCLVKGGKNK